MVQLFYTIKQYYCCCDVVIRSRQARRVVAKLRDEATIQLVAMETMIQSVVMSGQWHRQNQLQIIDQAVTEHQLQLMTVMMEQVT